MNRMLSLTAGMALAFLATSAHAATTTGVVVSTDAPTNVVTIETADGQKFSFERNDATTIEPAGNTTWFADLDPGATITVTSDDVPTDTTVRLLATHVRLDKTVAGAPVTVAANDELADRLPSTATPIALMTLVAMGSLIAGLGLRVRRS